MLQVKVGLVDSTGKISSSKLIASAAALNVQATRDLPQFWNINASVAYLPDPRQIPQGVWPIFLVKSLPPGEGGFHLTKGHNQPYSKVIASPDSDDWTIDASHEMAEMLVDPSGNRLLTSTSIEIVRGKIVDGTAKFEYLVEVCDPCEANNFGYQIDGVSVSDFITPHFYDRIAAPDARYSFTGAVKAPREILPGGYISWVNPQSGDMQQLLYVDPNAPPSIRNLGPAAGTSLREFVDSQTRSLIVKKRAAPSKSLIASRKSFAKNLHSAALARAARYR
jgi:hypothetical protein